MSASRPAPRIRIAVQLEDFDTAVESAALRGERRDIGAIVTFTGLCRSDGSAFAALELEHYPGMAEDEMRRVVDEALARWPLDGVCVIHRYGVIQPGANIVLVVTASAHREAAFLGASFLMDYLKTRAPFWKKEHRRDQGEGQWIDAKEADDHASARWTIGI